MEKEYIERTRELIVAVNAGARAIENTKRYHGATYVMDAFSDNSEEIPYLKAAKILREFENYLPAADVVKVVRCKDCKHLLPKKMICKHVGNRVFNTGKPTFSNHFCSYGERRCNND